ncbi:hypothetical protein Y032_0046g1385 [Ancylostoma ceylanicum]|uniref:Uncharacterized protein n=1 Tax=Ancylostoma ceylanicum TaxID=53326 RepID=A0A016UDN9_9BILA|nr:hypothetical protein Y032_0046g1385 [Ancylostoma ceylanicum]
MAHYRHQSESNSHIYRTVRVDSSMYGEFKQTFSDKQLFASLTPIADRLMSRRRPLKRSLSDKGKHAAKIMKYWTASCLHRSVSKRCLLCLMSQRLEPSIYSYKITQTPMKDVRAINQLIHKTRSCRFAGVTEIAPDAWKGML